MVEAHANSVEDRLIDGLSFKLSPGASYVQERKSVTFHATGSNAYQAKGGVKLIKLLVSGDSWMDPSTCRVMFDLRNLASSAADALVKKTLRPLGGPWSFFRRMRVLAGGQVVEDIDNYNRCHQLFSILTAKDSRDNDAVEGFGKRWDHINDLDADTVYNEHNFSGIREGQAQTVLFKPLSGLLNQPKYLPIRYCPITIELELVTNETDPIVGHAGAFTDENTSTNWQIENVQLKCDMCTLDNALDNSYAEHLLSGKALPINYNTYVSQLQSTLSGPNTGQKSLRLNVTRALSRLKSVFVTLISPGPTTDADRAYVGRKDWNNFYSPMHGLNMGLVNQFNSDGEFEAQLQLGSKLFPEYPIRSHSEAYYQLRKTMGIQSSSLHNFDIDSHDYRTWKFVWATDMEKVLEAGFTGANTRAGDILNVSFTHRDPETSHYAVGVHIILSSDNILEIKDSGCSVYD